MADQPSTTEISPAAPVHRATRRSWKAYGEAAVAFGREVVNMFLRVDALGLAKQVAFSVIFAALPTIVVLVMIASLVEDLLDIPVTSELRTYIVEETPEESHEMLLNGVDQAISEVSAEFASTGAVIAFLLAIWGGMGGVSTLIEATNRAYGVRNTRSLATKRLLTLAMTLAFTAVVVLTVLASFFGKKVVDSLNDWLGPFDWLTRFGQSFQYILSFSVTLLVIYLLFQHAPDLEHDARWTAPGAIISTLLWAGLLQLLGFIAARLPYENVFGAASAAILLLYFLYLGGLVVILGAILNGVLGERYDETRKRHLAQHPEKVRYVHFDQEQTSDAL